jgi:hypothetical protein
VAALATCPVGKVRVELQGFLLSGTAPGKILLFFMQIVGFACCITRKKAHRKNHFYDSCFLL